jgi:thioredoxin 1
MRTIGDSTAIRIEFGRIQVAMGIDPARHGPPECISRIHAKIIPMSPPAEIPQPSPFPTESLMSSHLITHISDNTFESEVLKSDKPVLVDFWAEWCGPCKQMAPSLDVLAAERAGQLKIVKLDVDGNQITSSKFGIRGIPTLILFKNGQAVATKVGALAMPQLKAFVESHL